MQNDIMLVMSLGIADVQDPIIQVNTACFKKPGFRCPYPTAVEKAEKYRNRDAADKYIICPWGTWQRITFLKKPA